MTVVDTEILVISSDIFYWICSPVHILHSNSALLCVYSIKIWSLANSCGFYSEKEILIYFLYFKLTFYATRCAGRYMQQSK